MTGMTRFLCSTASQDRDEPVFGTASRVDRWLLVEAPRPWGPRSLPQSRGLDDGVALALQQRAKQAHARLVLIRRPGRRSQQDFLDAGRVVYAADCRPGHEQLLRRVVADVGELDRLEPPFDGVVTTGWEPAATLVGVCTHGAHDACCAIAGRPVAAALAISHPELTWEISHIGGDRFAANVLVLPGGHYLGRVPPQRAAEMLDMVLDGQRPSPYYRGRITWRTPVQAAQELAAQHLGVTALDGLAPRQIAELRTHVWRVLLDGPDGAVLAADVEERESDEPVRLTCRAIGEHPVPSWRLLSLGPAEDQAAR
jgi:hypothetical protein